MVPKLIIKVSISPSTNLPLPYSIYVQEPTENDLLAEQVLHKVLEYHRTYKAKNTIKAYAPKQKEWQVSFFLFYYLFFIFYSFYV